MGGQVLKEDLEETPMAEGEQLNPLGGVSRISALWDGAGREDEESPAVALGSFLGALPESSWCPPAGGLQAGTGPSEDCARVGTKGSLK